MRITGLRATPVAVPFTQPEAWAFGERTGMVSVLLEVDTDEGLVGLGEAAAYPSADIIEAVLRTVEPLVVGESAFNIERIMKRINVVGTWHHVQATSPAIAAVEMALWDLLGKASSQPVVNLFGGRVRDEVEYFYYLSRKSPDGMAADAKVGRDADSGSSTSRRAPPTPTTTSSGWRRSMPRSGRTPGSASTPTSPGPPARPSGSSTRWRGSASSSPSSP